MNSLHAGLGPSAPGADAGVLPIAGLDGEVRRTTLPGGVRVVTERTVGAMSVALGCWVPVGSRHERPAVAGAAHFLEHLLFRGTSTRSGAEISDAMDAVGGDLNAFTGREYTCFHAQVLPEHTRTAVDLLVDVVLHGRCAPADVEIEGQVVLEELALRDDDPEDLAGDLFFEAVYPGHSLGRPVLGTEPTIEALTSRRLRAFHRRHYRPDTLVFAAAGAVDHDALCEFVAAASGGPGTRAAVTTPAGHPPFRPPSRRPARMVAARDGEQVQVAWGVRIPGRTHPDRWAVSVLNSIIGGGLSSRLFRTIREERGLAYSVYSTLDLFSDAGAFSVAAGCAAENLPEVVGLIAEAFARVAADGVTDTEVARARGQLRGALVLAHEDTHNRMTRLGRHELTATRRSASESLARIVEVTPAEVTAVARRIAAAPAAVAVVGPVSAGDLPGALGEGRTLTGVRPAR